MISLASGVQTAEVATKSTAEVRLPLWGDFSLSDPIFLALLPLVFVAFFWGKARWRHVAGRVSVLPGSDTDLPRSLAQRLAWLPTFMNMLALTLTVLALARPLRGNVELSSRSEGVDIALLVDRSSSMDARESRSDPTRFEIVKDVVGSFAVRRMSDREGAADNICLITFALYPELLCPFTLDADALTGLLVDVDTEKHRELDATGIGIALAKAVGVLRESESKSRVVVLLTDGKENVHAIEPLDAANLAAEEGIKVYTIFAGPRVEVRLSPFGGSSRLEVDTTELEQVAKITNAQFFHAETKEDLEAVYATIEALERTEREQQRFAENFDLYPKLLLPALGLYLLAWLCVCTWARRLP